MSKNDESNYNWPTAIVTIVVITLCAVICFGKEIRDFIDAFN